jgi:cell division protein FtsZ
VATGIDNTGQVRQPQPAESALRELAGKIRNDSRRIADRIERTTAHAAPSVESAAHAAVAAAILPATGIEDVSIRPMPLKPSLYEPAQAEAPAPEPHMPAAFIPPLPERTARSPRMPRIDELPMPAQNEIRAQRGELADDHPEKRRMSLMQRLASVGLGRRTESEPPPAAAIPRARPAPQYERPPQRPTPRHPEGRPPEPVSEYARRAAPQGLDPHGRNAPVHNSGEEDQLDIPAFLRRQAN